MLKNKLLILSCAIICFVSSCAMAKDVTLKELDSPKSPAYRVGLSDLPERQYIQAIEDPMAKVEQKYADVDNNPIGNVADLTYADLSIKRLSKEIAQELEYEEKDMVADLSLLWQGAATQSDTINFALYKLANPDADKPNEKSIKKVLTTIASMSTLVGASMGNPIIAGSSLIGGNVLGIMGQDAKALNYKYTHVNDADMIILIRKVEDLQQKAIDLYYDYMSAKKQLEYANDLVKDRQNKFELAQRNNAPRELIVITDAYYRAALDKQRSLKADFYSKRAALEQFVGNETFVQFEGELLAREKGETTVGEKTEPISKELNDEYNQTVKNIETFTSNVDKQNYQQEDKSSIITSENTQSSPNFDISSEGYPLEQPDIRLPEENSFYSDFPTGFAVELSLEEFFNPQKEQKSLKNKNKKERKVKKEKVKKERVKKEKAEKPAKIKPKKTKVEKPKKEKTKKIKEKKVSETVLTEEKLIEEKPVKEKKVKEKVKKEKVKKEKPVKEKEEKKQKVKPPKKEKDLYPELHGQKPLHKYPRNSTKDLIFLHGQDKHSVKKGINKNSETVQTPKNTQTETTVSAQEVEIPQNVKVDDFIPLMDTPKNPKPAYVQAPNEFNLPPLDAIRVPDLSHGGYSIHSEY